jgi:hypothetical protein
MPVFKFEAHIRDNSNWTGKKIHIIDPWKHCFTGEYLRHWRISKIDLMGSNWFGSGKEQGVKRSPLSPYAITT